MTKSQPRADAVVLLSGGVDSSTLLHVLRRQRPGARLIAVSFLYGQKHARELECARWQARAAGAAEHQVVDLSAFGSALARGSALTDPIRPVPDLAALAPAELDQPPTYVPNRNLTLLSLAAACAESRGCPEVCYGAQHQDRYGYWDCTSEFVERVNRVLALNRRTPVQVRAPFADLAKADVVRLGLEHGVDFARTWTCYRGESLACGVCPSCVERLAAFRTAGAADPLPYA